MTRTDIVDLDRGALEVLLKQVETSMTGTLTEYKAEWRKSVEDIGLYEAGFEQRSLGQVVAGVSFTLPSDAALIAAAFSAPLSSTMGGKTLDKMFDDFTKSEADMIQGTIRAGYAEGLTNQQIVQRVRGTAKANFSDGALAVINRHAEAVVRTSIQHTANQVRNDVWKANDSVIKRVRISATLDSRTSTQCFIGSTDVSALSQVNNVFKRKYTGDLVTIRTASGKKLCGTPNHPILTSNGWTSMAELNPFDQVVYTVCTEAVSATRDDEIDAPAEFREFFDALSKSTGSAVCSKRSTAGDFHGDGCARNGDVSVVNVKSKLRHAFKPSRLKAIKNVLLGIVKLPFSFLSDCHANLRLIGGVIINKSPVPDTVSLENAEDARLRATGNSFNFFNTRASFIKINYLLRFILGNLETLTPSEVLEASVPFKEARNGRGGGFVLSPDSGGGHATPIIGEHIIEKRIENTSALSCHVYNLSCDDGYYIAGQVVVKNCRSLDGQVYPKDKGPRPPFHFSCRTTTTAVLADKYAGLSKGRERFSRDPETGKVEYVSNQSYYTWLKTQPAKVQDSIIGPSRGKLLRNGGISSERFAELQLNKKFQPIALEGPGGMRKIDPVAFERAGL